MAVRVALHHKTTYKYAHPAAMSPHIIRLRPAPHNRTPIHHYSLTITPKEHFINWQQDPQGNYLARIVIPEKTPEFSVEVGLVADLAAYSPFDFFLEPDAEEYPFAYVDSLKEELEPFLELDGVTQVVRDFVAGLDQSERRTIEFLIDTNRAVQNAVGYVIRMEPGVQTPEETLVSGKGSCRDSAWLLIQVMRSLGIAARFVSGYLIQLTPDQKPVEGPEGPFQDFTDLHAWCECYLPGAGWVGLDPTSGLLAAEGHIPLAATPKPSSAAPIEGGVEKVDTEFSFEMNIERVIDKPRVTKPYTDEQWEGITSLGRSVDEHLQKSEVRLSVGGEPTFVSIEDPDAPEWNIAALGGRKEQIADSLLRRLQELWGKGGFLHHGQGKWYPGEQLPRWAFSCYYRRDGVPLWNDPSLFNNGEDLGHSSSDAERFVRSLIKRLGLERHGLMPTYEDVWYYLWRERKLPENVDPLKNQLADPLERKRLAKVFEQGLNSIVGWTLPLTHEDGWLSGNWFLRDEYCFLMPGDSPMGFRLPLDSLPWAHAVDQSQPPVRDPFSELPPLHDRYAFPARGADLARVWPERTAPPENENKSPQVQNRFSSDKSEKRSTKVSMPKVNRQKSHTSASPFERPLTGESAAGVTRTALCVEARGGALNLFMPPLRNLDHYLELVAAIEETAAELSLPVRLEGYGPPHDPRLSEFKVTPDPGVIEVNVPPTTSWDEMVQQTEQLYEAARQLKLAAEKFEVDGTHVGSGGGNHVVMGSLTAGDSPFLRRPDVLASLIRFWHNHPSLSYLFSGRFIGPTSQAPRVDEARDDSVYELEIALGHLQAHLSTSAPPPWLVDRVLRNLLIDVTGNTHRAEFCVDKLYSPDGPTGRLGLLEMRAFEMPPHERMSMVQQLLVRALLSVFWETPYTRPLIQWGTRLHDEYMLPFYVILDLKRAVDLIKDWGYDIDPSWFIPHEEFRFPRYGQVLLDGMSMEIRGALEPWNVLGEEAGGGGQARYVDSSVERVQVQVTGFVPERYQVSCNGYVVPLQATATNGEYVAGVRFRAWQPPSCLHPNIGIHAPLHFDFYDRWSERSVAGCTYHIVNPGGVSSDARPVNAAAAESRRLSRFEARGHKAPLASPLWIAPHPRFPVTLDLRRP